MAASFFVTATLRCRPGVPSALNYHLPASGKAKTNQQTDERTARVDHHIVHRRSSRWNKRLMKFVAGREQATRQPADKKEQNQSCLKASAATQRSPEQNRQDGVFRNMAKFSNQRLYHHHGRKRDVRIEPVQKRN